MIRASHLCRCRAQNPSRERGARYAEHLVRSVREALSSEMRLMVDLHSRTWLAMAFHFCRTFEPYDRTFFEEPCPAEDIEATAHLTWASYIPIATGERLVGSVPFRDIFNCHARHIVQPDLSNRGGLWQTRTIAVAPPSPNGTIAMAAAVHFAHAMSNWLNQKSISGYVLWRPKFLDAPIKICDLHCAVLDRRGLGIDVNERGGATHHSNRKRCNAYVT